MLAAQAAAAGELREAIGWHRRAVASRVRLVEHKGDDPYPRHLLVFDRLALAAALADAGQSPEAIEQVSLSAADLQDVAALLEAVRIVVRLGKQDGAEQALVACIRAALEAELVEPAELRGLVERDDALRPAIELPGIAALLAP